MKYSLLLSALIFTLAGYGQAWTKQYDHVDDCICGLSLVGKGDKHGFVDKDGKLVMITPSEKVSNGSTIK